MISIPDFFVGGVCRFEFVLRKPSDGVTPINANSTPTIVVVKNGSDTIESATVATTGVTGGYKVSYTPGSYAEGDFYAFRVTAAITDADFNGGSAFNHVETFTTRVKAVERGNDTAPLDAAATRNAIGLAAANLDTQLSGIGSTLAGVFDDADVSAMVTAIINAIETGLDGSDISVQAIATVTISQMLESEEIVALLANALAAKTAAESVNTKLTTDRAAKLDRDIATAANVTSAFAKIDSTLTIDGSNWKFTEAALVNAPGGESSIDPQPIIDGVLAGLPQPLVVESPTVASPGRLTALVRGCDYKTADGNPITVTVSTSANLNGATITLTAGRNGQTITATGSAVAHETIENRWIVTLEATATQTNKPAGDYVGIIKAVLTSGRVHPIGQNLTIPLRDVA